MTVGRAMIGAAAMLAAVGFPGLGCHQPPRTTVLTVEDYELIAADLAAALRADFATGFLAQRGPNSPTMTIAIEKVSNYTSDRMSDGARMMLMRKLAGALTRDVRRVKNVEFVIPAERVEHGTADGTFDEAMFGERRPTHVMTAVIRSATRLNDRDRTELYLCDGEIRSLEAGEVVWSGQVEFKRWARGRSWD